MKDYIITLIVLFCVDIVVKLICIFTETIPERTSRGMILDVFVGIIFVIWGIKLFI